MDLGLSALWIFEGSQNLQPHSTRQISVEKNSHCAKQYKKQNKKQNKINGFVTQELQLLKWYFAKY